jgi:hypothetical protein
MKTLTVFRAALAPAAPVAGAELWAQARTVEDFFRDFSAEWIRSSCAWSRR